jgi:hypothetical protein
MHRSLQARVEYQMKFIASLLLFSFASIAFAADPAPGNSQIRTACKDDIQQLCQNVKPGGGRIAACLKESKDKLSDNCKAQIAKARAQRSGKNNSTDNSDDSK